MNLKKILLVVFLFSCFVFNYNTSFAGFAEYEGYIKRGAVEESDSKKCANSCPTDQKYYQLTTGLPFLDANATKCSCVPVNQGMNVFLPGILKFILGSVGTITVIIIIVAGFMWSFSAGNAKIKSQATKMISDAIIGLVLTLTCGLMLQIVNPKLLQNNPFTVEGVNIESSGAGEGEYCSLDKKENINCAKGLICKKLSDFNHIIGGEYSYLEIIYTSKDGICASENKTIAPPWSDCDASNVCMSIFKNGRNINPASCNNRICKLQVTTKLGGACGSNYNAVCEPGLLCKALNNDFYSDSKKCYSEKCGIVIPAENTIGDDCTNPGVCCEIGSVCTKCDASICGSDKNICVKEENLSKYK